MAYTPNPTDVTQPADSVFASTAAAEFRALKAYLAAVVAGGGPGAPTPGQVVMFPGNTPLPGWLELNGALISRTTYAALYANAVLLGNIVTEAAWTAGSYGAFSSGDLATTFRLPDLRGVFARGWSNTRTGTNLDAGRAVGSAQNPTYVTDNGGNGGSVIVAAVTAGAVVNPDATDSLSQGYNTIVPTSSAVGNLVVKSVRPMNVAMMYCIKT